MTVKSYSSIMADSSFSSLGLSDWLVKQCDGMGFKQPTPVQINCIPPVIEGKNIPRGWEEFIIIIVIYV